MAKRKKTDIVGLKLRLREHLRRRLETRAKYEERSLNAEVIERLEKSFEQETTQLILAVLLARGPNSDLLRGIAQILLIVGEDWPRKPAASAMLAEAINKFIAFCIGQGDAPKKPIDDIHTGEDAAWMALVTMRAMISQYPSSQKWGPFIQMGDES
jgi:hypothetical protein